MREQSRLEAGHAVLGAQHVESVRVAAVERFPEEQERDAGRIVLARSELVDLQRALALDLLWMEGRSGDGLGEDVESLRQMPGEELGAQPETVAAGVPADGTAHRLHLPYQALRCPRLRSLGDEARQQHVDACLRSVLGAQTAAPRGAQREQRYGALFFDQEHAASG